MNTLLVTYDLMAPGKDYSRLHGFLESHSSWAKPVRSVYLIKTARSAEQFRDDVGAYIDRNDKLLVINVTDDSAAWWNLSNNVGSWIQNNL